MSTPTPTPRVDAVKFEAVVGREPDGSTRIELVVDSDFAELLETELAASQAREANRQWKPIDTAPTDNKRPLYLARLSPQGAVEYLDVDGIWEHETSGWDEPYYNSWYWASAHGIEDPTHWAYQDEGPPPAEVQPVVPLAVAQQLAEALEDATIKLRNLANAHNSVFIREVADRLSAPLAAFAPYKKP